MVQIPAAMPVTVLPLIVQTPGVVELKLIKRPEVAVAETEVVPPGGSVIAEKVMVLIDWATLPNGIAELLAAETALVPTELVAVTVKV